MKNSNLLTNFVGEKTLAIAVSGGVDSLTLATYAHRFFPGMVKIFHSATASVPPQATNRLRVLAAKEGWSLQVIDANEFNDKNYSLKMDKTIQSFKKDISTLRTGRANASMLDIIKVDVYGQLMPINQIATISVPEARLISIQVWDKSNLPLIDSAIQKSDLGVNPQIDGQIIRIRIPDLTEERRKELIKILKGMAEKNKVSIRNIRREANEDLKKKLKEKKISEDQNGVFEKNIQKITDNHISSIDKISEDKEKEISQI